MLVDEGDSGAREDFGSSAMQEEKWTRQNSIRARARPPVGYHAADVERNWLGSALVWGPRRPRLSAKRSSAG